MQVADYSLSVFVDEAGMAPADKVMLSVHPRWLASHYCCCLAVAAATAGIAAAGVLSSEMRDCPCQRGCQLTVHGAVTSVVLTSAEPGKNVVLVSMWSISMPAALLILPFPSSLQAPEVVSGQPASRSSDVFAFSIIMWELLTWVYPWAQYTGEGAVEGVSAQNLFRSTMLTCSGQQC